jgi:hypothetical protein
LTDQTIATHSSIIVKRLLDRFLPEDSSPPLESLLKRFLYSLLGVVSTSLVTFMYTVGQFFTVNSAQPRPITDFVAAIATIGTDWVAAVLIGLVLAAVCAAYALAIAHSLHRRGPLSLLLSGATLPMLMFALIRLGAQ